MYNPHCFPRHRWHIPKEQERNFFAAFFHMATIALTCTSLAQLGWFHLRGGQCAPHLAVYQFFTFGYFNNKVDIPTRNFGNSQHPSQTVTMTVHYYSPTGTLQCISPEIVNLMRVLILLCFLAMISSLIGFFLDIVGPTKKILKIIRRNSIPSILTVVWVVIIIGVCYCITLELEDVMRDLFPNSPVLVTYEYGCYTITAAGVVAVIASACNLLQRHTPIEDVNRRRLVDDWEGVESFIISGGFSETQLESIPPPLPPPPPYAP